VARQLEDWLRSYMAFTSDSESPAEFHFWAGVSTIAGALRRRVWIDMRKFQWTPNFYIVFVGPPGIASKSTALRAGTQLLAKVKGVRFGPPSITWQKLADALSESCEYMKYQLPGGVEELLPMSCLTIAVSELGTFLKMDDPNFVSVLIDLWDGQVGEWSHGTKTSGITEIKNPWINVIGCTTPTWLKENFPESSIGGGLTSRIIFIYGDKKHRLIPYPDEIVKDADYRSLEEKLTLDLQDIGLMSGPFQLSTKARTWGREWYERHWNGPRPTHMASDRYGGYLSRKQTHIHKLSIVLSAAESSSRIVEAVHLEKSEALLTSVEPHMLKVFESIGVAEEAGRIKELLPFLKAHGLLTVDELWAFVINLMDRRDFEMALRAGIKAGILRVGELNGKKGLMSVT